MFFGSNYQVLKVQFLVPFTGNGTKSFSVQKQLNGKGDEGIEGVIKNEKKTRAKVRCSFLRKRSIGEDVINTFKCLQYCHVLCYSKETIPP